MTNIIGRADLVPEYAERMTRCSAYGHVPVLPKPNEVQRVVCRICGQSWDTGGQDVPSPATKPAA